MGGNTLLGFWDLFEVPKLFIFFFWEFIRVVKPSHNNPEAVSKPFHIVLIHNNFLGIAWQYLKDLVVVKVFFFLFSMYVEQAFNWLDMDT